MRTGIDIVSIERIRRAAGRRGFLERVFTPGELGYAFSRRDPFCHLAGRFAAKEACSKALGTGLAKGVGWKDVEVVSRTGAGPVIELQGAARTHLSGRGVFVSISYSGEFAFALVAVDGYPGKKI